MRLRLNGITLPHHKKTKGMSPVRMDVPKTLCFPMHQNLGAPAVPSVKVGDEVKENQLIAQAAEGLSVPHFAPISGKVTYVDAKTIVIHA